MSFKTALEKIIESTTRKFRYANQYRYTVTTDPGSTAGVSGHVAVKTDGMPDHTDVQKVYGVPGVYATLAPDNQVMIGYEGGDPSRPVVYSYLPGVPAAVDLHANDRVQILKTAAPIPAAPVAISTALTTWMQSTNTALIALNAWVAAAALIPPLTVTAPLAGTAATATGAHTTSTGTAVQDYPVGVVSTVLSAD